MIPLSRKRDSQKINAHLKESKKARLKCEFQTGFTESIRFLSGWQDSNLLF
jgi:hypothetical protein